VPGDFAVPNKHSYSKIFPDPDPLFDTKETDTIYKKMEYTSSKVDFFYKNSLKLCMDQIFQQYDPSSIKHTLLYNYSNLLPISVTIDSHFSHCHQLSCSQLSSKNL
jgi:hypothetical protein